eukprot:11843466-Alexandrium_andersonii.AAC.1
MEQVKKIELGMNAAVNELNIKQCEGECAVHNREAESGAEVGTMQRGVQGALSELEEQLQKHEFDLQAEK